MDKWLLKFVMLFRGLFIRQGVDTDLMLTIVETKLLMDKRRVSMNWTRKGQKESERPLGKVLGMYVLFGFFISALILALPFIPAMIILHGYILFMMAMTLISDFSSVLLDTTDNQVILPRPVSDRTLFMARLVHILIYLLQFTIALSILPLGCTIYKAGLLIGIVLVLTILLTVLLTVFITFLLYMLVLRFVKEEKLREIITYFQIFMTVIFTLGFQILPRLIDFEGLSSSFRLHAWSYYLPPVWMALTLDAVGSRQIDSLHLLMILSAVLLPLFTFWLLIRYLVPSFTRKLAAVSNGSGVTGKVKGIPEAGGKARRKWYPSVFLSRLVCSNRTERGAFEITWKITGRDKGFRLQFYPGMAYILVFLFLFVLKGGSNIAQSWALLPSTKNYLWFIYLPLFTIGNSISIVAFNESYQASWIYYSTPVAGPGALVWGSIKALFVKYFMSCYLLLLALSWYIWGWKIAGHFAFGLLNNLLCFLIFANLSDHWLPFSRQPGIQQQAGKFVTILFQFLLVGFLVGIHYLVLHLPWVMIALSPLLALACWLLIKELQGLPWEKIVT